MMGVPFEKRASRAGGPHRLRRARAGPAGRPARDRGRRGQGRVRRPCPSGRRARRTPVEKAGQDAAGGLREGRPGLRGPVPARRPRPRLRRDALELARADGARRHGGRQHAAVEVPGRRHPRGVLAARGRLRADAPALRDARELLLRLERDAGAEPRPGGGAGRAHPRRVRLHPRPADRCSSSTEGEGLWRRLEHLKRNGNLYPTHGLGPGGAVPGHPPRATASSAWCR